MATLETADTQTFQTGTSALDPWQVPKPTNLADGDYVVLAASIDQDQALTWPTGFIEIDEENDPAAAFTCAAAFKKITNAAGEPATYDISNTGGERGVCFAMRVSGADGTTFLDVAHSTNSGNGTTATATGITTATANALVLAIMGRDNASSPWFTPSTGGWTEHVDNGNGSGSSGAGAAVAFKTQVAAGATGDFAGTLTSAPWVAFQVAIRPAGGGGGVSQLIGQSVESDVAQPVGAAKALAVGQAVESVIAQAVSAAKSLVIGPAVDVSVAQPVTAAGQVTALIGQAVESDIGHPLGSAKVLTIGQAVETDLGGGVTAREIIPIGIAVEADLAQAVEALGGFVVVHIEGRTYVVYDPSGSVAQLLDRGFSVAEVIPSETEA